MKYLLFTCRIFAGLVFVFSGFVKAIDPTGFAIKLEEYFMAFHLDFLTFTAMPAAILASSLELMIGLNLVLRIQTKFTTWLLMIFMSFFTILTFILALANPVSDCGCFGDAITLTNWETFWKNIIIFLPTVVLFLKREPSKYLFSQKTDWVYSSINFLVAIVISAYCLLHEPVIDFRPYKTGINISEQMVIPDDAAIDEYETTLIYEKEGVQQEFTQDDFPWQDTTWKWVETKQKLISKGYEPLIHDFSITNMNGSDITDQVLNDSSYVFLIIVPRIDKASPKGMQKMNDLTVRAGEYGFSAYCLTSSTFNQISKYMATHSPAFEICTIDETTVKTIMRSKPGLMIIQHGTILDKWSYRDAPAPVDISKDMIGYTLQENRQSHDVLVILSLLAVVVIFYLVVITVNSTINLNS